MYRALNEFLGQTAVDPTLQNAYRAGKIKSVLRECGFDATTAAKLALLQAPDFEAYLKRVYETVLEEIHQGRPEQHPWPTAGLATPEPALQRRGEAA